ncbi:STAS domain-containing protein [Streptomyces glaucescens]|uniref:Anti-sigma factor antagonist n=1 Tax=Streptomyces glaucescens TaxID=1907 RepID=A0A089X088_STRGA|nr:STAS domain-containing protein [Streptomyces glaucescens]AIR96393.1 hypothetical protein SGLAU_01825 [Streptomyces glaucescens]
MSPLQITLRDAVTGPVLEIAGEVDYTNAGELLDRVTGVALEPGRRIVLDLSGMTFCDSSGISALIAARNHALAARADFALAAVPDHTLRVLHIVGLDQILTFHPDVDSATRP